MNKFMNKARFEAMQGIEYKHGGPFGAVVVKDGQIVGKGHNRVLMKQDPTCHGEIEAIRDACQNLHTYDLTGCELYTTSYPCPMCKGAIQWANIKKVYYGCIIEDAEKIGFRDKQFYEGDNIEFEVVDRDWCLGLFEEYAQSQHTTY